MGLVVADALGVPVKFLSRADLLKNPVTDMRGFGTYHQPKGTWSDDSTMTLCLIESLLNGVDYPDIFNKFSLWFNEGYMTPHETCFGVGIATSMAIRRFNDGSEPLECGANPNTIMAMVL